MQRLQEVFTSTPICKELEDDNSIVPEFKGHEPRCQESDACCSQINAMAQMIFSHKGFCPWSHEVLDCTCKCLMLQSSHAVSWLYSSLLSMMACCFNNWASTST